MFNKRRMLCKASDATIIVLVFDIEKPSGTYGWRTLTLVPSRLKIKFPFYLQLQNGASTDKGGPYQMPEESKKFSFWYNSFYYPVILLSYCCL